MAKRFFYVSMGILALMVAYNLGARSAEADVDPMGMTGIAGTEHGIWWATCGEAWELTDAGSWIRRVEWDLPVTAGDIVILGFSQENLDGVGLVTQSGDVWVQAVGSGSWTLASPFPGSGTPTTKSSWGDVKRKFR